MLIYIDESIINAKRRGGHSWLMLRSTLTKIILSRCDKNHVIGMNMVTISELKTEKMNEIEYLTLLNIEKEYKDFFSLVKLANNKFIQLYYKRAKENIQGIPVNIESISNFNEAFLLTENLIDSKLYLEVTNRIIIKDYSRYRVTIKLEPKGGGGSTISGEASSSILLKRLGCIITDSDKVCPNDSVGDTRKSLTDSLYKLRLANETVFNLDEDFCEIESLIPVDLLLKLYPSSPILCFLYKFCSDPLLSKHFVFFPTRKGLSLTRSYKPQVNRIYNQYLENLRNCGVNVLSPDYFFSSDLITKTITKDVLQYILDYQIMFTLNNSNDSENFHTSQKHIWNKIFELLLFCGMTRNYDIEIT